MSESARTRIVEGLIQRGTENATPADAKTRRAKKAERDGQSKLGLQPRDTTPAQRPTEDGRPNEINAGPITFGQRRTAEEMEEARREALEGNMPIQDMDRIREHTEHIRKK